MGKARRCAFCTLGCKVNQYDTQGLVRLFRERGYDIVDFDEPADVYCVNTCTVTQASDKKSRQAVRRARRQNPSAVVAAVGCYAQAAPGEVAAIRGVDVVAGTHDRRRIVDLVELAMEGKGPLVSVGRVPCDEPFEELPVDGSAERVRGFVKVQDGCDERCAYCRVPHARGRSRSRRPENILVEAGRLIEAGLGEIVLTGVHLGGYGRDLDAAGSGERPDLAWLIERIHGIPGLGRLRLSSIEPLDVDDRLVETVAGLPKVARHFHIPLQSGDDAVLQRMERGYAAADYERLVDRIREATSPVGITTDIMVGFPGETERMFASTCELAERVGFSRVHVFKYSRRPGTAAALMPDQVSDAVRQARSETMIELSRELARRFHASLVGEYEEALVEARDPDRDRVTGLGSTYARIAVVGAAELVGEFARVRIVSCDACGVTGLPLASASLRKDLRPRTRSTP